MTTPTPAVRPADAVTAVAPVLRGILGVAGPTVVTSATSPAARALATALAGDASVRPAALVLTDWADPAASVPAAVREHRAARGTDPTIVVLPDVGLLAAGVDLAHARAALARFVTPDAVPDAPAPATGRLAGKVAMVTGAAQGFGLGIAEHLLAEGASVVLADVNVALAGREAERLASEHGAGRTQAVAVDVSDADSCVAAVASAVAVYGGIDLFVSNAGVLRAEGVMTQPVADFDLVTAVNYRGYFLCVRAVAPVMAAQHAADPSRWLDIVEINSKSGLEGSKRNFAYAGSKFGGIGLTQSFALELVEHGIKVNAVCPGNFLDGPLWSDPDRGLFVQYLRAGKVPGAQTVADVRRFYEAKVPMGRGCLPSDVARAIVYVVEQAYETGQAVPVTGGQNMLN